MVHRIVPAHDPATWPVRDRVAALYRLFPRRQLQRLVREVEADSRRCPRLPGWFLLVFVIGLGLFARDSYRQVVRWLSPKLAGGTPGRSTFAMARQRLGVNPLRRLAHLVVRLLADPKAHPNAFFHGRRLLAIDGFRLNLPDTPANAQHFGRPKGGRTPGAFPQVRVTALCELGTHVFWRWIAGPLSRGEMTQARELFHHLLADHLLLGDRADGNYPAVQAIRERNAHALLRLSRLAKFEVSKRLADGSFLTHIYPSWRDKRLERHGIEVRIIRYRLGRGKATRLLTTLLDAKAAPAKELIELYHRRWEEELSIDELKTHLLDGAGLRSQTVAGVEQEIEGVMLSHYVIRVLIVEAATAAGVEPTALSFVGALKVLRCRLADCRGGAKRQRTWAKAVIAEIGEEGLPERRERRNPRAIRQKMSKWPKKQPRRGRVKPATRYKITMLR